MDKRFVIPGLLKYNTERTEIVGADMAQFTFNTRRVLTELDIQNNVAETLYSQTLAPAIVMSPTVPILLPVANFNAPSIGGITRVAPNTVNVTKRGNYNFYVKITTNIGATLYLQMLINGVAYAEGTPIVGSLVGLGKAAVFTFPWSQIVDSSQNITFKIAADSNPVAGTPPVVTAIDVIVGFYTFTVSPV